MEQSSGGNRKSRRNPQQNEVPGKIGIELVQVATREYEFANCITDHNLTVNGVKVDFTRPKMAFKVVPPEILQEIELYLSELNLETDEGELEDFSSAARQSSSNEESLQQAPSETI